MGNAGFLSSAVAAAESFNTPNAPTMNGRCPRGPMTLEGNTVPPLQDYTTSERDLERVSFEFRVRGSRGSLVPFFEVLGASQTRRVLFCGVLEGFRKVLFTGVCFGS